MTCTPGDCWCDTLPVLPTPEPSRGCYCPSCLKSLTDAITRDQCTEDSGRSP
jgi:hypothetical protein